MRIVIDMQGAQSASRYRGIGRYTISFAQAVVRNKGEHEIVLALSGLFPETIESIRKTFDGFLPQEQIRVWNAPSPVSEKSDANDDRRKVAELLREAFLASLDPNVIHISSLFEGYLDDAVTSIACFDKTIPVTTTLYDLIPLQNPGQYLKPSKSYEDYYHTKIDSLKKSASLLAISEFSRQEGVEVLKFSNDDVVNISSAIDSQFDKRQVADTAKIKLLKKFSIDRPFILCVGASDERKNLPRLISAYAALPSHLRESYQLVLAGGMDAYHVDSFKKNVAKHGLRPSEVVFTGVLSDDELVQFYNLCTLFVFPSWHEGFGLPALEAMSCGAPVLGANTASLPEVIDFPEALFDPFDVSAISLKLAQALEDKAFRLALSEHGLQQSKKFSWDKTALSAIRTWENLVSGKTQSKVDLAAQISYQSLLEAIAGYAKGMDEGELVALSYCLSQNFNSGFKNWQIPSALVDDKRRQIMVDISELVQQDAKTGVQRVVRCILKEWLVTPPKNYRIEPVYATTEGGYRYARSFVNQLIGINEGLSGDLPIEYVPGDIFLGLDFQPQVQVAQRAFYQELRRFGVSVKFVVYDVLSVSMPQYFPSGAKEAFTKWLDVVGESDGAVCISQTVAVEVAEMLGWCSLGDRRPFTIDWFHLGADEEGEATKGLPPDASFVLAQLEDRPSFLMVGTLEPRKGHAQVFDAFELLWNEGLDVNLVIVGKQGWMVDELVSRIQSHTQLNKRLFWLEGISDEYLEQVYVASSCLVASSYGEGFGLPLIEAAQRNLPIIARDLPVFREVAGDCAYYFKADRPAEMAEALKNWLVKYREGSLPKSHDVTWLTWKQSAHQLFAALGLEKHTF